MTDQDVLRSQLVAELEQATFTPEQKQQLIARLAPRTRSRVFGWRRGASRTILAAATTMALAGSAVAITSSQGLSPSDVVAQVFRSEPAETQLVDKIGHPIGASDSDKGVRVTADSIIGDEQNYAVVFTIEKDDGSAFEGLPAVGQQGLLPLGFKQAHTDFGRFTGAGGSSYFFDADPNDHAIQYVEEMTISGTDGLQGKTAKVTLKDLAVAGGEVIAKGTWKMKFQIAYQDASVPGATGQEFTVPAGTGCITKQSVSPMAINVEYEVEAPSFNSHSEYSDLPAAEAILNDGTTVKLSQRGSHCDASEDIKRCSTTLKFPRVIDPKDVKELRF